MGAVEGRTPENKSFLPKIKQYQIRETTPIKKGFFFLLFHTKGIKKGRNGPNGYKYNTSKDEEIADSKRIRRVYELLHLPLLREVYTMVRELGKKKNSFINRTYKLRYPIQTITHRKTTQHHFEVSSLMH
jgi:hypothetical protein